MNRLATLAMTTMSLLFVGMALRASDGISYAQQRSDSDNVNAAVNAFHAALSNLDIGAAIAGSWFPTTHPGCQNKPRRRGYRMSCHAQLTHLVDETAAFDSMGVFDGVSR